MVTDPYFCLKIEVNGLESLKEEISDLFGVQALVPLDCNYHISLSYVLGSITPEDVDVELGDLKALITESITSLKPKKIVLLNGLTTDFYYVVMEIEKTDGIMTLIEHLEDDFETKAFENDISTHISLFKIKKQDLRINDTEELALVSDTIQGLIYICDKSIKINVTGIECFSKDQLQHQSVKIAA
jgi:hypothetical protein